MKKPKVEVNKRRIGIGGSGQAISEAVVALIVIVALLVGGTHLLLDIGKLMYLKLKLCSASDAAARYCADQTFWLGARRPSPWFSNDAIEKKTKETIDVVLSKQGIDTAKLSYEFSRSSKTCAVKLTLENIPFILGSASLSEISSAPYPNDSPIGVLGHGATNLGVGQGSYLPTYGAGANTEGPQSFPGARFPYWGAGFRDGTLVGAFQNSTGGGPFRQYQSEF
jgi:hypothetical protein